MRLLTTMPLGGLVLALLLGCEAGPRSEEPAGSAPAETARAAMPAAESGPPAAGSIAPELELADQNGRTVSLAGARGREVVLVFYRAHW